MQTGGGAHGWNCCFPRQRRIVGLSPFFHSQSRRRQLRTVRKDNTVANKRGFTLIELLVVISIIAVLIGLLLPAIGKARDASKVTVSLSNLQNFGKAHATYSSEWNGRAWTTA